jgi:hypothetical protein
MHYLWTTEKETSKTSSEETTGLIQLAPQSSKSIYLVRVDETYTYGIIPLESQQKYIIHDDWIFTQLIELPRLIPRWCVRPFLYYYACPHYSSSTTK